MKFTLTLLTFFILLTSCSDQKNSSKAPQIIVSNFVLFDILRNISKDKIAIDYLIPHGVDIHTFAPTPRDVVKIKSASLFIYSGDILEHSISKFVLDAKSLDVSKSVVLEKFHDEHQHSHQFAYDPHFWFDISNVKIIAKEITQSLVKLDTKNETFYNSNLKKYIKKLNSLELDYINSFKGCKKNAILVTHNAFGYLANEYGFEIHSIHGVSSESMPSAKVLSSLVDEVKELDINTLFFESFVSDKLAKTISNETGVKVDMLYTISNVSKDDFENGADYISLMKINMFKISSALECK